MSEDLIIKGAKGIKDGLYVIKDGELFKYKPNHGTVYTVRSYHITDRPRGEWIDMPYSPSHTKYMCSECGETVYTNSDYIKEHKFCFSCGADMRGETDEL